VSAGVAVRRATLADLSTITELRLALLREYGDHPLYGRLRLDVEARATELYRAQLSSSSEVVFLAERHGRIVGMLRCVDSVSSPLLYPDRYCYVSSVYVRPAERRRGVLRALYDAAVAWCDEHGLDEMRLHNAASSAVASQTWAALGFEVVELVRRKILHEPVASTPAEHAVHAEAH
jgi:ribosomal protein S18 acetylase RimI-like enzyme